MNRILRGILEATPDYDRHRSWVELLDAWPRAVGETVARHCRPARLFDDGVLLVTAENSAWLQSLRYLETQILAKLEQETGKRSATKILFRIEVTST